MPNNKYTLSINKKPIFRKQDSLATASPNLPFRKWKAMYGLYKENKKCEWYKNNFLKTSPYFSPQQIIEFFFSSS